MLTLYKDKDLAKKLKRLKIQGKVERGSVIGWLVAFVGLIIARNAGYVKQVVTDIASIFSSCIAAIGIGGRQIVDRNKPHIRRLAYDLEKATDRICNIKSLDDIEIIPINVKEGSYLKSENATPFKKGHYIVINSSPAGFILEQTEQDGKKSVRVLSPDETCEVVDELAIENEFVEKNIMRLKKSYIPQKSMCDRER